MPHRARHRDTARATPADGGRTRTGLVLLVCTVSVLLILGGCARKKPPRAPIPVPPPAAAPPVEPEVPTSLPAPRDVPPVHGLLAPPDACLPSAQQPWWECTYRSQTGESLSYFLYLPAKATGSEPLPVVVFLHGSSASGGGDKTLQGSHRWGSSLWIQEDVQTRHPSVVVVPQAQPGPGETWVRTWRPPPAGGGKPKEALVLVVELLEALSRRLPLDEMRWYLTGQSMGGFGTWLAYTRYPGKFAALVPVCGGGDPAAVAANATAVWAFHGDKDTVVTVGRSREMVSAIQRAGGSVRYTEYEGMGHNIFERAFAEPDLVPWLFSQRLP